MRKMEQVVRYKCQWCGKEFKTPDRHVCKWDPDCKNCLSCKYRGKFVEGAHTAESTVNGFECHCEEGNVYAVGEGGWNDFPQAATAYFEVDFKGKERRCPDYKRIKGYKGKETFREIESQRRIKEVDEMTKGSGVRE